MLIKTVAVQAQMGRPLSLEEKIHVFKQRADFVCLPEYYSLEKDTPDYHRAALRVGEHKEYLARLSADWGTCLVGGSVVEPRESGLYNTSYIINRGNFLTGYRKRHPTEEERAQGILAGNDLVVYDIEGVRIGIMICADIFHDEMFFEFAARDTDVIFVPTVSPYLNQDTARDKYERDQRYFVEGARKAGAYVVKVCGVGSLLGKPLQGRSLIAAPWGVVQQVGIAGEQRRQILTQTLDVSEVREFRRKRLQQTVRSLGLGHVH